MVAKHDVAHRHLVEQLVEKSVTRKYTALVHGVIPHNLGTIEAPIGRNPKERQDMAVVDDGKMRSLTLTSLNVSKTLHLLNVFLKQDVRTRSECI